jgi:hypothetical protein
VWRDEPLWVMVIRAHEIECAQWLRSPRGKPASLNKLTFETSRSESPDATMHRAVREIAGSFARQSAAIPSRPPGARLRVLVCDRWIALATVPWGQALTGAASRDRFLRGQFEAGGFAMLATDTVRFDDSAGFGQPRIAAAYPASLMEVLAGAAITLGARLESVHPLEVAAAQLVRSAAGRSTRALAIVDGERLLFMDAAPGGMTAGQSIVDPALLTNRAAVMRALWQRQRLRGTTPPKPGRLSALDLSGSDTNGAPTLNDDVSFVALGRAGGDELLPAMRAALSLDPGASLNGSTSPPKRGPTGWLVCGACVIMAAALAVHAFRLHGAARAQELASQRQLRVPAVQSPPKWSREELARIQAVNAAIREINLPIGPLLRAVRPPRDLRVALLGISVEPTSATNAPDGSLATIKLSAESASGAEMARYVGHLAKEQPLIRAYLVNHVVDETDSAYPYRFNVELSWRE